MVVVLCTLYLMLSHECEFEVLIAVSKIQVFWDVKPFNLVNRYHCFDGAFCLYLQGLNSPRLDSLTFDPTCF
jgi:hypothetical protein